MVIIGTKTSLQDGAPDVSASRSEKSSESCLDTSDTSVVSILYSVDSVNQVCPIGLFRVTTQSVRQLSLYMVPAATFCMVNWPLPIV